MLAEGCTSKIYNYNSFNINNISRGSNEVHYGIGLGSNSEFSRLCYGAS